MSKLRILFLVPSKKNIGPKTKALIDLYKKFGYRLTIKDTSDKISGLSFERVICDEYIYG